MKICLKFSFAWEEERLERKQLLTGTHMNSSLPFLYFYSTCIGQNLFKHDYRIPLLLFWLLRMRQFLVVYCYSLYTEKLCIFSNAPVENLKKIRLQGISMKTPVIHYIQLILKQDQQQSNLLICILGKLSVKKETEKYPEVF